MYKTYLGKYYLGEEQKYVKKFNKSTWQTRKSFRQPWTGIRKYKPMIKYICFY